MNYNLRQHYIELESHYTPDGETVRVQECLHCGETLDLERIHGDGSVTFPMTEHIILEHL